MGTPALGNQPPEAQTPCVYCLLLLRNRLTFAALRAVLQWSAEPTLRNDCRWNDRHCNFLPCVVTVTLMIVTAMTVTEVLFLLFLFGLAACLCCLMLLLVFCFRGTLWSSVPFWQQPAKGSA